MISNTIVNKIANKLKFCEGNNTTKDGFSAYKEITISANITMVIRISTCKLNIQTWEERCKEHMYFGNKMLFSFVFENESDVDAVENSINTEEIKEYVFNSNAIKDDKDLEKVVEILTMLIGTQEVNGYRVVGRNVKFKYNNGRYGTALLHLSDGYGDSYVIEDDHCYVTYNRGADGKLREATHIYSKCCKKTTKSLVSLDELQLLFFFYYFLNILEKLILFSKIKLFIVVDEL